MADQPLIVLTIGHSNVPIGRLLELLKTHGVEVLVDVRSQPFSRYASQFNKEPLQAALRQAGLRYLFLGDCLGGRPSEPEFYDADGHVLYGRMAEQPRFKAGIDRLLDGARKLRITLMCGEEDPLECHRRLLVGRVLKTRGAELLHIRQSGELQTDEQVEELHVTGRERQRRHAGQQLSLFGDDGNASQKEVVPWRSTRSVSPRHQPSDSSDDSGRPGSSA